MPDDGRVVLVIEAEVYSRVVGYYRPIQQYNPGKKLEAMERKNIRLRCPDDWPSAVLPPLGCAEKGPCVADEGTPEPVRFVRGDTRD